MPGIFVSYRRQDGGPWAGRIYDWLTGYWGRANVFMDIDTIAPGEDFRVAIARTLTECDVALVVIGPKWLNAVDETGGRRLDDAGDVHRTEVVSALSRDDVRVVPVLVGDATMPRFADLPEPLRGLIYRNAAFVDDRRFGTDMHALNESLVALAQRLVDERRPDPAEVAPVEPTGTATEPAAERPVFVAREQATSERTEPPPAAPPTRLPPLADTGGDGADPSRPDRRRLLAWAVGAALVVVALVVGAVLAFGGDDDPGGDQVSYGVDVSGTEPWTDTGIDLTVGDRVEVYASGTVLHNAAEPSTEVGPDGASDADVAPNIDLNKPGNGVYVNPPGHGGLIARVGSGSPFAVGASLENYEVLGNGRLWLGINDYGENKAAEAVANNGGAFTVEIVVTRA